LNWNHNYLRKWYRCLQLEILNQYPLVFISWSKNKSIQNSMGLFFISANIKCISSFKIFPLATLWVTRAFYKMTKILFRSLRLCLRVWSVRLNLKFDPMFMTIKEQ
jgi:hypothetical protein